MDTSDDLKKKLFALADAYDMPDEAREVIQKANIALLVGVAGAGKNTILEEMLKDERYYNTVSSTSRDPRMINGELEKDGVIYHFVGVQGMIDLIESNAMVEAQVIHRKQVSGTSISELQRSIDENKVATSDVEVAGVEYFKRASEAVKAIFVLPPSFEAWQERNAKRYGDPVKHAHEIRERLITGQHELQRAIDDGYFIFVVNHDYHDAANEIGEIVFDGAPGHHEGPVLAKKLLDEVTEYLANN